MNSMIKSSRCQFTTICNGSNTITRLPCPLNFLIKSKGLLPFHIEICPSSELNAILLFDKDTILIIKLVLAPFVSIICFNVFSSISHILFYLIHLRLNTHFLVDKLRKSYCLWWYVQLHNYCFSVDYIFVLSEREAILPSDKRCILIICSLFFSVCIQHISEISIEVSSNIIL